MRRLVMLGLVSCTIEHDLAQCGENLCPVGAECHPDGTCGPRPPPPPDSDADGIADSEDNCPTVANTGQVDRDGDFIGDACDNCALVQNSDQANVGDNDGIGDTCDPHPGSSDDCLVLVDTFSDEAQFSANWTVLAPASGSVVWHPDGVLITPASPTSRLGMTPKTASGDFVMGATTVHAIARAVLTTGTVGVFAQAAALDDGYSCAVTASTAALNYRESSTMSTSAYGPLVTTPISDEIRLNLSVDDARARTICVAYYGLALGLVGLDTPTPLSGAAGVFAYGDAIRIRGFELMSVGSGGNCPPPIVR